MTNSHKGNPAANSKARLLGSSGLILRSFPADQFPWSSHTPCFSNSLALKIKYITSSTLAACPTNPSNPTTLTFLNTTKLKYG